MSIVRRSVKAVVPARVRRRLRAAQWNATAKWQQLRLRQKALGAANEQNANETRAVLAQLQHLAAVQAAALSRLEEALGAHVVRTAEASRESAEQSAAALAGLVATLRSISMAQDDDVTAGRSIHHQLRMITELLTKLQHRPVRLAALPGAAGEDSSLSTHPLASSDR